ncbi:alg9-like mannosyltransferase [Phlyctema vagabunda]|uniref:Mannosyltransferase n=1 Tax=Phlyctema vagabunda TaxID=108571 RepID=A0ABR4PY09_9HELO
MMSARTPPPPDILDIPDGPPELLDDNDLHPIVNEYFARDILKVLLVLRFVNALCIGTFFQPDEYFQSQEPAWQMAFGTESGAWITWEWHKQLRSSLHPAIFAAFYYGCTKVMRALSFFPQFQAILLAVLPNSLQSLIAGLGDYYTWRLAEKLYGTGSDAAWTALMMSIFSPWQWFCSTRTFSNCLETTLTIAALHFWPWKMAGGDEADRSRAKSTSPPKQDDEGLFQSTASVNSLRVSLLSAALACILRPTNLMLWFSIIPLTVFRPFLQGQSRIQPQDYLIILREAVLCGTTILLLSGVSDRLYFGEWTFPPYQWLTFNITQDLAVFYGSMPFHYYLSQGLPLLLTTYLPFLVAAPFLSTPTQSTKTQNISFILTATVASTLAIMSLIAHKEVRFIYPLLPIFHILLAPTITGFFSTTETITKFPEPFPSTPIITTSVVGRRGYLKTLLLLGNICIGYYTTQVHQSGVISVIGFLRGEYESLALDVRGNLLSANVTIPGVAPLEEWEVSDYTDAETFVGFLMPCHSTPWRSMLVHPGLKAWALGCEPPLAIPARTAERENYRDEADRFYDDAKKFLSEEVGGRDKPWPRYIVGFQGVEEILREWYEETAPGFLVKERWRTFNSHWHDDERRKGDVVVWEFVDGSEIQRRY